MTEDFVNPTVQSLRNKALCLPGVTEGTSCVKRAFKAGNKGFLYLGETADAFNVMVKLDASSEEAAKLAHDDPDHYAFGSTNWMTAKFAADDSLPDGQFEAWVEESFRVQAPRKLLEELEVADEA